MTRSALRAALDPALLARVESALERAGAPVESELGWLIERAEARGATSEQLALAACLLAVLGGSASPGAGS